MKSLNKRLIASTLFLPLWYSIDIRKADARHI